MIEDLLKTRCPLCGCWLFENKLDKNIQGFTWSPRLQTSCWDKYKKQGKFIITDCYDISRIAAFKEKVKQRLLEILKVLFNFDVYAMIGKIPLRLSGDVKLVEPKLNLDGEISWKKK